MGLKYIQLAEESFVACAKEGKMYHYYFSQSPDLDYDNVESGEKSPTKLTKESKVGKVIFNELFETEKVIFTNKKKKVPESKEDIDFCKKRASVKFRQIIKELKKNVTDLKQQQKVADEEWDTKEVQKVEKQYQLFEKRRVEYGYTQLEYLCQIVKGLGVGDGLGIVKAYLTFLQTILGLKGTNVIAIGEQSSGKTHMIEQALDMIPQRFIHRGILTKSAFFKEHNGMNLDGHIFYLGDLGGVGDDEQTIAFRDVLKQLSTDGEVKRMITEEGESITEKVTGNPSICYTTVKDAIINEQEKSRSHILIPPAVSPLQLMVYDTIMESKGEFTSELNRIEEDKRSVCGLTYHLLNTVEYIELFNPYMYVVENFFHNMVDFNRKIKEFNNLLKIVCVLSDAYTIEHDIYVDRNDDNYTSTLYIASKKNVLTALHLFSDGIGLLPTEIALLKGLSEKFVLVDVEAEADGQVDFSAFGIEPEDEAIEEWDSTTDFTVDTVKQFRNCRWYRNIKDTISDKLQSLAEKGFLIRKGKTKQNRILYSIPNTIEDNITHIKPNWDTKLTNKGVELFHELFPAFIEEFDEFISRDRTIQPKYLTGELDECEIYDLAWER